MEIMDFFVQPYFVNHSEYLLFSPQAIRFHFWTSQSFGATRNVYIAFCSHNCILIPQIEKKCKTHQQYFDSLKFEVNKLKVGMNKYQ